MKVAGGRSPLAASAPSIVLVAGLRVAAHPAVAACATSLRPLRLLLSPPPCPPAAQPSST